MNTILKKAADGKAGYLISPRSTRQKWGKAQPHTIEVTDNNGEIVLCQAVSLGTAEQIRMVLLLEGYSEYPQS